MHSFFRRKPLAMLGSTILMGSTLVLTGCDDDDDVSTAATTTTDRPALLRLATAPLGAEFTGMLVNSDGAFFLNIQHPSDRNTTADASGNVFNRGTIGAIVGVNFNRLGDVAAMDTPTETTDREVVKTAVGSYQVLAQQSDSLTDGNSMGDIIATDGSTLIKNSSNPDFNAAIADGNGGFYLYTNWEDRPGGMSRIRLSALGNGGYASIVRQGMLDFSSVKGTWVNCFGTISPWGTPFSGEELYFDDTVDWYDSTADNFSHAQAITRYFGYDTDPATATAWGNPYDYGYIVEIGTNHTVTAANEAHITVNKLELMGRFSHENAVVMPDQRSVFLSDDGTGTVLFKFVADTAGDMSAGTLYAAKVSQSGPGASETSSDPAETSFAVEWVELGNASEATIEAAIRQYDGTLSEAKHITDAQIEQYALGSNPFGDDRIAFLESRKAAAAMGATAEFRKMEGININQGLANSWWNNGGADGNQTYMYLAMSSYDATMADDSGDIQLDGTHGKCGLVYRMKLVRNAGGLVDVSTMQPAIVGGPYDVSNTGNACSTDNISNPDNLVILDDGRVLIGEDTGHHTNNVVWLFDDPAI
jgi:hypothetical protein